MKSGSLVLVLMLSLAFESFMMVADAQEVSRVKRRVDPLYPELLKLAGIEGGVEIRAFVNQLGIVDSVESIKGSHQAFVQATVVAVKQWEFMPVLHDGKPIRSEIVIPFEFKLGAGEYRSIHDDLFALQKTVTQFIQGAAPESMKDHIDQKAYAVVDRRFESLSSLIGDTKQRKLIVEGPGTIVDLSSTMIGPSDDSAVCMMKSQPSSGRKLRYHTLVYMRSHDGQWKIQAWHVSP